jgi:hypothetical protein
MFNGAALMWRVKKQDTHALSSVEAETVALTEGGKDAVFCQDICAWFDFDFGEPRPVELCCDNRGAIARHTGYSDKLRHVSLKEFFIRELVDNEQVFVKWISGLLNPADLGTMAVGGTYTSCTIIFTWIYLFSRQCLDSGVLEACRARSGQDIYETRAEVSAWNSAC